MTAIQDRSGIDSEAVTKMLASIYPIRRVGYVEDTTHAIMFLATDNSSFITGASVATDGGYIVSSHLNEI